MGPMQINVGPSGPELQKFVPQCLSVGRFRSFGAKKLGRRKESASGSTIRCSNAAVSVPSPNVRISTYEWQYKGKTISVPYSTVGDGKPGLMLPAMSTVSWRSEIQGLAERMGEMHRWLVPDWPGFGESTSPPLEYGPDVFQQFLTDFTASMFASSVPVVAAGHSAGFVLQLGCEDLGKWSKVVMVAPTWFGPFKVMGLSPNVKSFARSLIRSPFIGETIFNLLTTPDQLRGQYKSHVFVNEDILTDDFIEKKRKITQRNGGRFAPASFVTGYLDPVEERSELLALAQSLKVPLMLVVGEDTPKKTRAEIDGLASLEGLIVKRVRGALAPHEEFPDEVARVVLPFLA